VAPLQHALARERTRRGRQPTAAEVCRRYGISKQVWSRVVLGHRWAGETAFAVLTEAVLARSGPRPGAD
jgi:hypothetical protein